MPNANPNKSPLITDFRRKRFIQICGRRAKTFPMNTDEDDYPYQLTSVYVW